jgi:hypothetical protein
VALAEHPATTLDSNTSAATLNFRFSIVNCDDTAGHPIAATDTKLP